MQISKSILCLWISCAVSAASCAFVFGALHVLTVASSGADFGGDGPENISINFPMYLALAIATLGAAMAIISLLISWLLNKQAFFSRPHVASLLFLLPLVLASLLWLD